MLTAPLRAQNMARRFPVSHACYVLENKPFALSALLDEALGDDPKREARARIREHILGLPSGEGPMGAFRGALETLASAPLPPAPLSHGEQQRIMGTELSAVLQRLMGSKAHSASE